MSFFVPDLFYVPTKEISVISICLTSSCSQTLLIVFPLCESDNFNTIVLMKLKKIFVQSLVVFYTPQLQTLSYLMAFNPECAAQMITKIHHFVGPYSQIEILGACLRNFTQPEHREKKVIL